MEPEYPADDLESAREFAELMQGPDDDMLWGDDPLECDACGSPHCRGCAAPPDPVEMPWDDSL